MSVCVLNAKLSLVGHLSSGVAVFSFNVLLVLPHGLAWHEWELSFSVNIKGLRKYKIKINISFPFRLTSNERGAKIMNEKNVPLLFIFFS